MKKSIILVISLFIISSAIVFANDCNILKPTLEQFYNASKDENLEDFMSVIDIDYAKENLFENYEDYVKSAWEIYDISDYKIKVYNCKIENNNAIFYFNLKSTLVWDETIEVQRNYIWVFHKLDSWKIRYVMDEEIFDKYQNAKYGNLFVGATDAIIDKTISDVENSIEIAEQWTEYIEKLMKENEERNIELLSDSAENLDGEDSGKWETGEKISGNSIENDESTCRLPYIILLSIIFFILYKFIRLKDYKKLKNLDNKSKAKFIWKKSWKYLKEYGKITWTFSKKVAIIIAKFLKASYIKSKPIVIKLAKKILEIIKKISKKKEVKERENTTPKE